MAENSIDVIEDLVETLEDGHQGFEKVAERLEEDGNNDIAKRMRHFSAQRARMSAELRDLAAARGFEIEENGSATGAMHRSWISLKDALSGDDPSSVLAAAEEGEDHAVEEFEDALQDEALDAELRAVVEEQAAQVRAAHDEVRRLRDSAQS